MYPKFFEEYFESIRKEISSVDTQKLIDISALIKAASDSSKKIILVGNGGSAAMASHVAVDLTKAAQVRAINFNEADLITCFANDYGFEQWVVEALVAYADPGDLVILISSSGQSRNLINGAIQARKMGLKLVTLSGFDKENPLRKFGDVELWVNNSSYNIVEMTHHIWLVAIVDYIIAFKNKTSK